MNLVVHSGVYKTASTSFQYICHNNFSQLLGKGIFFIETKLIHYAVIKATQGNWQAFKNIFIDVFKKVKWYFVFRAHFEYFESLYYEMSKHNIVINYLNMGKSILKWRYFNIGNTFFNWSFIFDYNNSIKNLKNIFDGDIISHTFDKFKNGYPGK